MIHRSASTRRDCQAKPSRSRLTSPARPGFAHRRSRPPLLCLRAWGRLLSDSGPIEFRGSSAILPAARLSRTSGSANAPQIVFNCSEYGEQGFLRPALRPFARTAIQVSERVLFGNAWLPGPTKLRLRFDGVSRLNQLDGHPAHRVALTAAQPDHLRLPSPRTEGLAKAPERAANSLPALSAGDFHSQTKRKTRVPTSRDSRTARRTPAPPWAARAPQKENQCQEN